MARRRSTLRRPDKFRPTQRRPGLTRSTIVLLTAVALAACSSSPQPAIEVTERDGPFAPLDMSLTGLPPGTDVTLEASAVVDYVRFDSSARFAVSDDGTVDLVQVSPRSGGWEAADPMAPIWSMSGRSGFDPSAWDEPYTIDLALRDGDGELLAESEVERPGSAPDVEVRRVDDAGLVAEYAVPEGLDPAEPRPAVLVFGGSEGGLQTGASTARWIAALGYPALGISYFGSTGQPSELAEVPVETFLDALDWLHGQPGVDTDAVATFGVSRGGEMALWLAAERPELVHAAFAPAGASLLFCGFPDDSVPAWDLDGEPLADVCPFRYGAESLPRMTIDVQDIAGPVVLACGERDELWPSCDLAQDAASRRGAGETTVVRNEHAGHAVALAPYAPLALGPDTFEGYGVASEAVPGATHQVRVEFWEEVATVLGELREGA